MPNIDSIEGIKINIYNGDHLPPHVHVLYNEFEVLLIIKSKKVYAGYLPGKQLKKAKDWLIKNEQEALEIFYVLNPQLKPK